ncbi:MAG: glutamine synthetase III [Cytophagales bacterium]|nr:glutamine synthetase III [Cytophagales bacterium]
MVSNHSTVRGDILRELSTRKLPRSRRPEARVPDYFGLDVLDVHKLRERLPEGIYEKLSEVLHGDTGKKIDEAVAAGVVKSVREWALHRGATHYTHWFQPLTGATAEKHSTFFDPTQKIESLDVSTLSQQEPDASSFPSGGLRSTFEARGYTLWDPSSPFFILEGTLCIPTVFISYTGDSLDYKSPLLRSCRSLNRTATLLCQRFYPEVHSVIAELGWEQEYFIVDKAWVQARPDLVMVGRTLLGYAAPRGQQLSDHYFGSIPPRVVSFMQEVEYRAHLLGIPLEARHNEVAPSQFEAAPVFESMNIAVDHNQLLRELMNRIAGKHNLCVLFHEKPFHKLNGTGKHCNWSLTAESNRGRLNLMKPSTDPKQNLLFFTVFINTLRAVHIHAPLLRASVATYGNDFRLGSHEAPPAIISSFIGSYLSGVLENFIKTHQLNLDSSRSYMGHGIKEIPELEKHDTDRNRTSPFAFTGNKFEFRSPGSSVNPSGPCTVLNTIVAAQLDDFYQEVKGLDVEGDAYRKALAARAEEVLPVIFNGDGYTEKWVVEAKKRKLPHLKDTPRALASYVSNQTVEIFEKMNVCSRRELEARKDTELDIYVNKAKIEADLLVEMVLTHVLPAALSHQTRAMKNIQEAESLGIKHPVLLAEIKYIANCIESLYQEVESLQKKLKEIRKIESIEEQAISYAEEIRGIYFQRIRTWADKLEAKIGDEFWPLPKYREMLFLR